MTQLYSIFKVDIISGGVKDNMSELFGSISSLSGIGKKRLENYKKLGISTPYDLLCYYPRRYIDFTSPKHINQCDIGSKGVVRGTIINKSVVNTQRLTIYKSMVQETDTNQIFEVVIFNNVYAHSSLLIGKEYIFYGKVNEGMQYLQISSPSVSPVENPVKLQSLYHLTNGLTNPMIYTNLKQCLAIFDSSPFETLPPKVIEDNSLISLQDALHLIHFPTCINDVIRARRRLAFEELFLLQIGMSLLKNVAKSETGCIMENKDISELYESLPFELTNGQKNAINDIISDMCGETPMNRLVQGDVGSGKTMVSIVACYFAFKNGFQSTIMAPTEILAQQHYKTFCDILEPLGVKVALLTGSLTPKNKKIIRNAIEDGSVNVIVGTHALIQKDTIFNKLGLVITDEQHRFGVEQRSKLFNKGDYPHKLVMSATPIPRTLGLLIYGDLDISMIKELPKGRQPISTFAICGNNLRKRAFNYVIDELNDGGQAYIVCPMIDESEDEDLKSVYKYANDIQYTVFKDFRVGLLHGKMSSEEKEIIMQSFKNHELDILVSTTVIEVGVDVPNASIILIENADRFGLSQLHQLRGRVGRGSRKSTCILITEKANEEVRNRMRIMSSTNDGFKIAEEDFNIRGCGDFLGHRQHGLPSLKIADLVNDMELLENAKIYANYVILDDPKLSKPQNLPIQTEFKRMFTNIVED